MRSPLMTIAVSLAAVWVCAMAVVDYPEEIQALEAFLIRQMEWFDGVRPPKQPPLKQTFGWDTSLCFPPCELNPPPCCAPPCAPGPLPEMRWRGDTYDHSLDAIWFTEQARLDVVSGRDPCGNLGRARRLLDAGIFLGDHDPKGDGRLRAAYRADNLLNLAGTESSIMDPDAGTGNIAWFGIALTRFYDVATCAGYVDPGTRQTYLDGAKAKGQWILDHCSSAGCCGFTGGYGGWSQAPFGWKSTEHNIDVWTLAQNLYGLTGEAKWATMASSAACFVQSMYVEVDASTGYYRTGTLADGCMPNPSPIPADAQAWTALARRGAVSIDCDDRATKAMRWLLDNLKGGCECEDLPANGVKFSDVGKNMQCEVTASAAFALFWLGYETCEAQTFIDLLAWVRVNAAPPYDAIADGIGLVATPCSAGTWTGYGPDAWYFRLLHCASSDWYGLTYLHVHKGADWANPLAPVTNRAAPPGDLDRDGDVDLFDFAVFASCVTGPAIPHDGSETCQQADLNQELSVDLSDFGIFQRCYSGEDLADPNCAS